MSDLLQRSDVLLDPDPARVVARLFVPGHELVLQSESRATGVLARILGLPEDAVAPTLAEVLRGFVGRHRDLPALLRQHADLISHRLPAGPELTPDRRELLGAYFTHEYAVEAAALCNPSAVPHPDQSGLAVGELRFVLSVRGIGEGHLSSIGFRTGVLAADGAVHLDDPGPYVETGRARPTTYDRELFGATLAVMGADAESSRYLAGRLPAVFGDVDLDAALVALAGQRLTRQGGPHTESLARQAAECSYEVEFAAATALAERVLWPQGPSESRGMEDARFVLATADDGSQTYRATYTAFDGLRVAVQLIETTDFRCFRISQVGGPGARDKGLALFPRTVGGRHLALSRWDRENISLTSSVDGRWWDDAVTVHAPSRPWELIQTGNCGSPVETDAGWLVLTHGVGPMREYVLGALLLDRDDPTTVLGALREPLLRASAAEAEGYVPHVVYSCGALLHGDRLLLPYGASDAAVRFAVVDVPALLARLTEDGPPATTRANSAA